MKEQPTPKYLRPELLASESERVESPALKAERAIGSTVELARLSSSELTRVGEKISGLREGAARNHLEKRQGILSRRLSGFQKKLAATLAGLAFAAGVGRTGSETPRAPSEHVAVADTRAEARGAQEEADLQPGDPELEEDEVFDDVTDAAVPNADPFAAPGEKKDDALEHMLADEAADAKENLKFEEEAKQEELAAMRDYADLVVDDLLADGTNTHEMDGGLDALHEIFREKAKEIGADEEEFIHQGDEAYLTRYGSVVKKVLEAPGTITPEERPLAEEFRQQLRESEADHQATEGSTEDDNDQEEGI